MISRYSSRQVSLYEEFLTTRKMLAGRDLEEDEDVNEDAASIYPLTEAERVLLRGKPVRPHGGCTVGCPPHPLQQRSD